MKVKTTSLRPNYGIYMCVKYVIQDSVHNINLVIEMKLWMWYDQMKYESEIYTLTNEGTSLFFLPS